MKQFFLAGSIFCIVILLIILFQNLSTSAQGFWFLFINFDQYTIGSMLVLALSGLGFITGVFVTAFLTTILNHKEEEEPGGTNTW